MPLTLRPASTLSTVRPTVTTSGTTRRNRSITRPELREIASAADDPSELQARALKSHRPVCFDATDGYVDTGVWWRPDLRAGDQIQGPAIIEEFGSTVPIHPGFTVRVDSLGNLVITRGA